MIMEQQCDKTALALLSRITYACLPLQSIGGADVIMELFAAVEQQCDNTALAFLYPASRMLACHCSPLGVRM